MRPRGKRRLRFVEAKQLEILVDFVSNNIGVLAVLTAFVAIVIVFNPLGRRSPGTPSGKMPGSGPSTVQPRAPADPPRIPEVEVLSVPWSHSSQKNPVFAALVGGRVKLLDLSPLYEELLRRPQPTRVRPVDVQRPGVVTRFFPITNDVYCFQFRLSENAGEPLAEARQSGSAWTQERDRFDAERYFYFFWVTGDSFEAFRTLREQLRDEGVEVAWKPVRAGSPLELCQGVDGGSNLTPQ